MKSTECGKFSRGQESVVQLTGGSSLEFSVMFSVYCIHYSTVQNVYSAVQAVDQQLAAGHQHQSEDKIVITSHIHISIYKNKSQLF